MFERLKSLPLTIVLTILIWMYAESQVNSTRTEDRLTLPNVPVCINGPADELAQFQVSVDPPSVSVAVSGTSDQIDVLRHQTPAEGVYPGVYAYVAITADDHPAGTYVSRQLHVELPLGVALAGPPPVVSFRMIARPRPAAAGLPQDLNTPRASKQSAAVSK